MPRTIRTIEARFWERVAKSDGCWLWTGPSSDNGYGRIGKGGRGGGVEYVHRLSYEMHRGPIPPGMQVCHTCDVRRCVNPNHFFLGNHADNMHDAMRKGRIDTRGAGNAMSTITTEQALEIRERHDRGEGGASISRAMGITVGIVRRVGNRTRWGHLPEIDAERHRRAGLRIADEVERAKNSA